MQRREQHFQAVAVVVVVVVAEYLLKTGFVQGTAIPEPIGDSPQIEGRECLASSLLQILLFFVRWLDTATPPNEHHTSQSTQLPPFHHHFTTILRI
jgi:hypothetical protein